MPSRKANKPKRRQRSARRLNISRYKATAKAYDEYKAAASRALDEVDEARQRGKLAELKLAEAEAALTKSRDLCKDQDQRLKDGALAYARLVHFIATLPSRKDGTGPRDPETASEAQIVSDSREYLLKETHRLKAEIEKLKIKGDNYDQCAARMIKAVQILAWDGPDNDMDELTPEEEAGQYSTKVSVPEWLKPD
jgi:hypothetical protein